MLQEISNSLSVVALELCEKANLKAGQVVVVGCSTSEILGHVIGSHSNKEVGETVFKALFDVFSKQGVYIAGQCCEHLNRAIIVESEVAGDFQVVNAVPTAEAGGAFATAVYLGLKNPVALETFSADAGIDIGNTLIGMHLKRVAVPLRLDIKTIGEATVVVARTRPPLIGGSRASYDEKLM